MSKDIDDLDLTRVGASQDDRISHRDRVEVQGVGGMGAVKGIFNRANAPRLIFAGIALAAVVGGFIYSFVSATPNLAGGAGTVEGSGNARVSRNNRPSEMQIRAADQYNNTGLAEKQKTEPSAHPIVVTTDEDDGGFPRQQEFRTGKKLSDTKISSEVETKPVDVVPRHAVAKAGPTAAQLELLKKLLDNEAAEPKLQVVSIAYSSPGVTNSSAARSSAKGEVVENNSVKHIAGELPNKCENPIIRAGRQYVSHATMAWNSDVGGDLIVEIDNGPLRTHRLIGKAEKKEDFARLTFTKMVGVSDPRAVQAIGLDMDTVLNAVSGDVDSHTLYRYGWWGVGAVLSAVGKAAQSSSNTSTVYVGDSVVQTTAKDSSRELKVAAGELGQSIGEVFKDRINRPSTVKLHVNDQVGIVFMDDVCGDK